jgi:hypothetical protein
MGIGLYFTIFLIYKVRTIIKLRSYLSCFNQLAECTDIQLNLLSERLLNRVNLFSAVFFSPVFSKVRTWSSQSIKKMASLGVVIDSMVVLVK